MAGGGSQKGKRRGGRKKGTPNKLNADVKEMIVGALNEVGGQSYLVQQSIENPVAFMSLIGRVLPMQMQGDKDAPLKTILEIAWQSPLRVNG